MWTYNRIPTAFMLLDAATVGVAVFRIWRMLRVVRVVSLNEKYMCLHVVMLILMAGVTFVLNFFLEIIKHDGKALSVWIVNELV